MEVTVPQARKAFLPTAYQWQSETSCGTLQATLSQAFTFNNTLSPIVTSVEPAYGSSGGGTLITLSGSALAPLAARSGSQVVLETNFFQTAVQIGGVPCQVSMGPHTLKPQGFGCPATAWPRPWCSRIVHAGGLDSQSRLWLGAGSLALLCLHFPCQSQARLAVLCCPALLQPTALSWLPCRC